MMNHKILHTASALLGLSLLVAGCHSSVVEEGPSSKESAGKTHLTMHVSVLRDADSRALVQPDENAVEGTGEGKVSDMQFWLSGGIGTLADYNVSDIGNDSYKGFFEIKDFGGSAKELDYKVILNAAPWCDLTTATAENAVTFEDMYQITSPNGFTMTGDLGGKMTVHPGVLVPSQPDNNFIPAKDNESFPVERVVSKARVRYASGETLKVNIPIEISPIRCWTVAGSAKSVYLFRNHAGTRKMNDKGLYEGLITVSAKDKQAGGYDLTKVSAFLMNTTGGTDGFQRLPKELVRDESKELSFHHEPIYIASGSTDDYKRTGKYFLEHALTETKGKDAPYAKDVTYRDIAYAKIYIASAWPKHYFNYENHASEKLVFSSVEEAKADGSLLADVTTSLVAEDGQKLRIHSGNGQVQTYFQERWYWIDLTKFAPEWLTANESKIPADRKKTATPKSDSQAHTYFLVHDIKGTFYVGADGVYYDTLLSAIIAGNTSATKYNGGRMVYLTPLNAQGEEGKIYNCDTRRNNIYDLSIVSIDGLGYNYDPVDPKDPYCPEVVDNPLEPNHPVPSINKTKVGLKVKARILNWNYTHRSYDLLEGTNVEETSAQ